jgi:PAS domain S-box-containing protein
LSDGELTREELVQQVQALRERLARYEPAEETLRDNQRFLENLLANLPGMAYQGRADQYRTLTFVSQGAWSLTGYSAGELMAPEGFPLTRLIHPDDRASAWAALEAALRERRPYRLVYRIQTAAGKNKWAWDRGTGVFSERGTLLGLEGFLTTINRRRRAEERSRQSAARLRLVTEQMPAVVWTTDTDLRFTSSLGAGLAGLNLKPNEVVGMLLTEYFGTADPAFPALAGHLRALRGGSASFLYGGEGHTFQCHVEPLTDDTGRAVGVVGVALDVTERRQAEEELQEANELLRSLIRAMPLALIAIDPASNVTRWNPAAERIFGWTWEEVKGRPLPIIPADKQEEFRAFREIELKGQAREASELRRLRKDGSLVDISIWTAPIHDAQGALRYTIGILADITERKRTEARLREQAEQLRTLSRRLLEVQELERRYLACELHDEIGQVLTALKLVLERGTRLPAGERRESLHEAHQMVKDLTRRVRDLSLRLRPTMLDDLGLLPALLWLFDRYTAQTAVTVRFEHRGLDCRLHPPEVETAAYRIVQEAINNVARHAQVREVIVRVWVDQDLLAIQVQDGGVGFSPEATRAQGASSGLSGMQERAVLLDGHVTVASRPGQGTRVTAELPLHAPGERPPGAAPAVVP